MDESESVEVDSARGLGARTENRDGVTGSRDEGADGERVCDGSARGEADDRTRDEGSDTAHGEDDDSAHGEDAALRAGVLPPVLREFADETREALSRIAAATQSFQERVSAYENVNQRLHARVEELQVDQVRSLLTPIFERLATLHTQASKSADDSRERDAGSADEFDYFAQSIDEVLSLYDLRSVEADIGQEFDAKKHHATRRQTTDEPLLDSTIQRVHRQGFTFLGADRVFLPATVSVYRYVPTTTSRNESQ